MLTRRSFIGAAAIATAALSIPSRAAASEGDGYVDYIPTGRPPRARYWAEGSVLNQRNVPMCEAFSLVGGWIAATGSNMTTTEGNRLSRYIYNNADSKNMPSHESHMRLAKELGMVSSWTWIQSVDDLVDAVCHHGPAIMGVRSNARFRSTNGRIVKGPGFGDWEGHSVVATAYVPFDKRSGRGPSLRIRNSWGPSWGKGGSAWMTVADLKENIGPQPYRGYYQDSVLPVWTKPGS